MQQSQLPSSPTFGSFSTAVDVAAVAARVVQELADQAPLPDSEFEFAFDCNHCRSGPIATADEIFSNGQIRPSNPYPLLTCSDSPAAEATAEDGSPHPTTTANLRRRRPPLRKLMSEERNSACSPSPASSEAEEDFTGVSPEMYCAWTPKRQTDVDSGEDRLRELSSTSPSEREIKSNNNNNNNNGGSSSKRWKLRSLLYARSTSYKKEKFMILTPAKKKTEKSTAGEAKPTSTIAGRREGESYGEEESKRRGKVPYRKDMDGILRNVNGLSRHLRPF